MTIVSLVHVFFSFQIIVLHLFILAGNVWCAISFICYILPAPSLFQHHSCMFYFISHWSQFCMFSLFSESTLIGRSLLLITICFTYTIAQPQPAFWLPSGLSSHAVSTFLPLFIFAGRVLLLSVMLHVHCCPASASFPPCCSVPVLQLSAKSSIFTIP